MNRLIAATWAPAAIFGTSYSLFWLFGLLCSAENPFEKGLWLWVIGAGAVAGTVTAPTWWLLVVRRGRPTPHRGALAGAVAGVVLHLAVLSVLLADVLWRQRVQGQPFTVDPVRLAPMLLVVVVSNMTISGGGGALLGWLVAIGHQQRRTGRRTRSER